jgi:hypothetical protein
MTVLGTSVEVVSATMGEEVPAGIVELVSADTDEVVLVSSSAEPSITVIVRTPKLQRESMQSSYSHSSVPLNPAFGVYITVAFPVASHKPLVPLVMLVIIAEGVLSTT